MAKKRLDCIECGWYFGEHSTACSRRPTELQEHLVDGPVDTWTDRLAAWVVVAAALAMAGLFVYGVLQ